MLALYANFAAKWGQNGFKKTKKNFVNSLRIKFCNHQQLGTAKL
jgi:hypothetical protein